MGFGQTEDFGIIFGTNKSTRKYANIQHNPHVAIVIGWDEDTTVQLEGKATELSNTADDMRLVEDAYWAKNPAAKQYSGIEGQVYFLVRTSWVRYVVKSQDTYEFWV